MGINSTEVSYNFGQLGSVFCDNTDIIKPPTGKVFVAIQILSGPANFAASGGLVADNNVVAGTEYIGTEVAAHDAVLSPDLGESGSGGGQIDQLNDFPAGTTIFGRWTQIKLNTTATIIAYIGA